MIVELTGTKMFLLTCSVCYWRQQPRANHIPGKVCSFVVGVVCFVYFFSRSGTGSSEELTFTELKAKCMSRNTLRGIQLSFTWEMSYYGKQSPQVKLSLSEVCLQCNKFHSELLDWKNTSTLSFKNYQDRTTILFWWAWKTSFSISTDTYMKCSYELHTRETHFIPCHSTVQSKNDK